MDRFVSTSEIPRINQLDGSLESVSTPRPGREPANESPVWTTAAPEKVVERWRAGEVDQAWRAWRKYLARRQSPLADTPFDTLGTTRVLQWGLPEQEDEPRLPTLAPDPSKTPPSVNKRQPPSGETTTNGQAKSVEPKSLELLAGAYELPVLVAHLPRQKWWDVLAELRQAAVDAAALDLSSLPLWHQQLAGELPLALAILFPEIERCAGLLPAAKIALSAGMGEVLDGEGMPHCRYLGIHQPLVACWTRARILASALGKNCWNDEAEAQYRFAVREMLRLARRDGQSLFSARPVEPRPSLSTASFFAAAAELSRNKKNRSIVCGFPGFRLAKQRKNAGQHMPAAANHSEWSQAAVLRPNWRRSSPRLGVAYGERTIRAALVMGRDRLLVGEWGFTCLVNQKAATLDGDWEEVCWVTDDDVDYLELQVELTEGIRIQRQICLARRDRFLFIADAVLGGEAHTLKHTLHLPLTDAHATPAAETREVALSARKPRALLFPLALPEWRSDRRGGELTTSNGVVQLQQAAETCSLYAPLWVDLDPQRHSRSFTWRQLAVAEERRNVPPDTAVGYRVQFGKEQWLIYRSLAPARNRTVMGHNLVSEFLIARFGRDGSVKSLIEVE